MRSTTVPRAFVRSARSQSSAAVSVSSQPPVASKTSRRKARGASTSESPTYRLFSSTRQEAKKPSPKDRSGMMTAPTSGRRSNTSTKSATTVGSRTMSESMNTTMSPVDSAAPRLRCALRSGFWSSTRSASSWAISTVPSVELLSTTMTSTSSCVWLLHDSRHAASVRAELRVGTIRLTRIFLMPLSGSYVENRPSRSGLPAPRSRIRL